MGEDKANRGTLWIAIQQQFLVLHNQLIGIHIICRSFLTAYLRVNHLAFFVDGEVSGVSLLSRNGLQILHVVILTDANLQTSNDIIILFHKHLSINTVSRLSGFIINTIFCHFVNEKQGENLDTLIEQLPFSLYMGQNRLPDLNTAQLILADLANHIPGIDLDAIQKFHRIIASVDMGHHKTLFILLHIAGIIV